MNIVKLVQGSAEWHEHRRRYRNASETPAVLGVSPWQTPYQLWQQKLGLVKPEVTTAMLRGIELEPAARAAYEAQTGRVMQPLVLAEGEYSASLDGITLGGERIVEIKCPFKGRESALWQAAVAGELPEHYRWQVQHQLAVAQAEIADVFVFDGREGLHIEVRPDAGCWARIREAWDSFWPFVAQRTPPPLAQGDLVQRDDEEWREAASTYAAARRTADDAQRLLDDAKAQLIALATHTSETGGGVTVTRYWKKGAIEYKRVPELRGVDLEQYRGEPREETRVTTVV
jgi:putative phage-type endonuclease